MPRSSVRVLAIAAGLVSVSVLSAGCLEAVGFGIGTFRPGGEGHFEIKPPRLVYAPGERFTAKIFFINDAQKDVKSPQLESFEWFLIGPEGPVGHGWIDQSPPESERVHPRDRAIVGEVSFNLVDPDYGQPYPPGRYAVKMQWKDLWGEGFFEIQEPSAVAKREGSGCVQEGC
ncbi:MAG TPA: hypothetical protein VM889_10145 [Candidatus Thermoplasmatota archaeon]|nr:hypothetical protein [Candidatus Thermoplasmatota archaeon]